MSYVVIIGQRNGLPTPKYITCLKFCRNEERKGGGVKGGGVEGGGGEGGGGGVRSGGPRRYEEEEEEEPSL